MADEMYRGKAELVPRGPCRARASLPCDHGAGQEIQAFFPPGPPGLLSRQAANRRRSTTLTGYLFSINANKNTLLFYIDAKADK